MTEKRVVQVSPLADKCRLHVMQQRTFVIESKYMLSTSDERRGENYVLLIGVMLRRTDPILSVQERYRHRGKAILNAP